MALKRKCPNCGTTVPPLIPGLITVTLWIIFVLIVLRSVYVMGRVDERNLQQYIEGIRS